MPKIATGHVRWVNGQAVARIRVTSSSRIDFVLPTCVTHAEALERSRQLAAIARRMRAAQADEPTKRKVLDTIASATPRMLGAAISVAEELAGGKLEPIPAIPPAPTFRQVCEQWTGGELSKRYPDQIRAKRTVDDDISRLTNHVYPIIGDVPINRITLDHCEEVMRRLPPALAVATRRNIGQLITRALRIAVYPLRLISASPLPQGFLPAAPKQKALAYLYPDEDRRLLACRSVPLEYRLLWGFLTREGMREGEALALTWADLDLTRGAVRLDKNKTDEPRAWALAPGSADALRAYRTLGLHEATPVDRVFVAPGGIPIVGSGALGLPARLRAHLRVIGLHRERPELFSTTNERHQIRVHDLRGTFVTVSLANGRNESWISDRTGHRSSQMIARYKRTARTFSELNIGTLLPLDAAIPELSIGHGTATAAANYRERLASPAGFEPASPT